MAETTEKKLFSVKDLIWFGALIVSITSSFIITQVQTTRNSDDINKLKSTLEQNNLELINYKLSDIQSKQNDFSKAFNTFLDDYYKHPR